MSSQQDDDGYPAGGGPYGAQPGREYDPYAGQSSARDPYAVGPGGSDPYAAAPPDADGFGPSFSSASSAAPSGNLAGPYQGPAYGPVPGYGAVRPSSGSAIAGFVLGLLGIVMCGGLTAPVGIFLSAKGMRETGPAATSPRDGRGLAIAGLVLSIVGLIPLLIMLAYIVLLIVVVGAESTY